MVLDGFLATILGMALYQRISHLANGVQQVTGLITTALLDLGIPLAVGNIVGSVYRAFQWQGNGTGNPQGNESQQRKGHQAEKKADFLGAEIVRAAGIQCVSKRLVALLFEGFLVRLVGVLEATNVADALIQIIGGRIAVNQAARQGGGFADIGAEAATQILHTARQARVGATNIRKSLLELGGTTLRFLQQIRVSLGDGSNKGFTDSNEIHIVGINQLQNGKVLAFNTFQVINIGFGDIKAVGRINDEQHNPQPGHRQDLQPH